MSTKSNALLSKELAKYEVRSDRTSLLESTVKLAVWVNGQSYEVLNISESGLAFKADIQFMKNQAIDDLRVLFDETELLYEGKAILVWSRSDGKSNHHGIAFTSGHLSENLLKALDSALVIKTEISDDHAKFMQMPKDFLLYIYELKSYLANLKTKIDALESKTYILSHGSQESFAKAVDVVIGREVVPQLLDFGRRVNDLAKTFPNKETYKQAKEIFRRELHEYYKESSFVERAWKKPLGYAGDYEMMNQIYRNNFEGRSLFSRLMHRWGINEPSSQSVRYRRGYLKEKIKKLTNDNKNIVVGSLASGPAKEICDFLAEVPENVVAQYTFVLMDQDTEALLNAKRNIVDIAAKRQINVNVVYIPVSVKQILEGSEVAEKLSGMNFDFLYTAGLYDYLTQPVAKLLSYEVLSWVRSGGEMIIGNFHPNNPSHTIGDFAGEWSLIQRTEQDMLDLIPDGKVKSKKLHFDDQKIDLFLEVVK